MKNCFFISRVHRKAKRGRYGFLNFILALEGAPKVPIIGFHFLGISDRFTVTNVCCKKILRVILMEISLYISVEIDEKIKD